MKFFSFLIDIGKGICVVLFSFVFGIILAAMVWKADAQSTPAWTATPTASPTPPSTPGDPVASNVYGLNVLTPAGVGELAFNADGTLTGWWKTHFQGHKACTATLSGTYSVGSVVDQASSANVVVAELEVSNKCIGRPITETVTFVPTLGGKHITYDAESPAQGIQHGDGDAE